MTVKWSLSDPGQKLASGVAWAIRAAEGFRNKKALRLLGAFVTGLLVAVTAFLIWQSRKTLVDVLQTARYEYLVGVFGLYSVSIAWVAFGWHLVVRHLGSQSSLLVDLKAYVYTLAARRLPGPLWYVAGRTVLGGRLGIPRRVSALSSGIEVVLSIVSGIIVGMPAILMQTKGAGFAIGIFVLIELLGLTLLHPKVLQGLLARLGHQIQPGRLAASRVLSWLGAYVAMWLSGGLMTYVLVAAIYPVDVSHLPRIVSLWALTGVVSYVGFFLPHNLGLSEVALSGLLSSVLPLSIAVATAVLMRVLTTVFDLMWSSLLLWELKGLRDQDRPD